jgi:hypothetical protein
MPPRNFISRSLLIGILLGIALAVLILVLAQWFLGNYSLTLPSAKERTSRIRRLRPHRRYRAACAQLGRAWSLVGQGVRLRWTGR